MPHPGEGVLDAGSDAAMLRVVRLLTGQEWSAGPFAMRDDEAGMDVGPVAGHRDTFAVLGEAGAAPDLAVGPVSWGRPGGGNDQTRVRVDDDLHVRGESVVPARGCDRPVVDRNRLAVHAP